MMQTQRYSDEVSCPQCNELDVDCACERIRELHRSLASISMEIRETRIRQATLSYDDAMAQRALREYGYVR